MSTSKNKPKITLDRLIFRLPAGEKKRIAKAAAIAEMDLTDFAVTTLK